MVTVRYQAILRTAGYWLASAVVLWLVWRGFDGAQAWQRLKVADLSWLLIAWCLLTIQLLASSLRWQLTARQLGLRIATPKAIGQYYVSMLCNLTLPGGVLGDAGRAWHNRQQTDLATSAAAVVLERVAGQLAMVLALVIALSWQLRSTVFTHPFWSIGVGLSVALFIAWAPRLPRAAWLERLIGWMHDAWFSQHARWQQLGYTSLILGANLMAFYACARAVDVPLSAGSALLVLPATLLVMALPVSVAGWGVREAGAALIWPIAGVPSDAAIAASVAYGLMATASALPGLWWLVGARGGSFGHRD